MPGAFEEKGFDAIAGVEVIDRRGEFVGSALALRQRFEEAADAERRIGDEQIKGAVLNLRVGRVPGHERVAVADIDARLAIHEGGDLRDFREAVFLFDAVDGGVVVGDVLQRVMLREERLQLQRQLGEEVPGSAGVINGLGRSGVRFHQAVQRQAHQQEAADGAGREVLPFALLHALIEEALEHVAEKLIVLMVADEADVLPHLQDFQEHLGVLVKELFVVNVDEGEVVVREKFLLDEKVPDSALGGIWILADEAQGIADIALGDVGDVFAEKLAHAFLVELLEAVEQLEVGVVGDAFPIEFQVVRILGFIHELAEEEIDQLVESVLAPGDVVLAEDGGELVIFLLLIGRGDGVEIGERVFVFADVVGLDVRLENARWNEVEFVSVAPDGESLFALRRGGEAFEKRIGREVFFVVAVGDDVAAVMDRAVFKMRGVEAEELRGPLLLDVAEKLIAILESAAPRAVKLTASGLALDDKERLGGVVPDEDIRPPAACAVAEFPLRLQLDVPGLVAFFEQPVNTLKDHEIFRRGEVAGLALVDDEALILGIDEGFVLHIDRETRGAKNFAPQPAVLREAEDGQEHQERIFLERVCHKDAAGCAIAAGLATRLENFPRDANTKLRSENLWDALCLAGKPVAPDGARVVSVCHRQRGERHSDF